MKRQSNVTFDDLAEVTIKGQVGGREVEYTGSIKNFDVITSGGERIPEPWENEWSLKVRNYSSLFAPVTYYIKFEEVDGKAITAKISEKPVTHTARTHYGELGNNPKLVEKCRTECGAPDDATFWIDFREKTIEFKWKVGVR